MGARILIVEDEATIAAGLHDSLVTEGYEVEVARDGPDGERRARARPFDLILLDLMLPGKDGLDVCRDLRAAGVRTPIIILTVRSDEQDKVAGLELGADDYVTKPFRPRELRARVKALLRRVADGRPAGGVHEAAGLVFDFDRFEARRGREVLKLTPTEMRILRSLLGRRGRVLLTEDMIAEVWGPGTHMSEGVIHTHINNLRGKIEPDPAHPTLITTVRGVGYRFEG